MTTPAPAFSDPAEAARFGQYRQAQIEEYSTYIAAENIYVGTALAFAPGHPVPKSTAEAQGWDKDGTCLPFGSPLPDPKLDRAAQLRARADELERQRQAIEAELAAAEGPAQPDYARMTLVQLRDDLATRGLPTSGNKDELVARLQADDTEEE